MEQRPVDDESVTSAVDMEDEPEPAPGSQPVNRWSSNERIGVGSGDENVAKIQLAARWTEAFAPHAGDSLEAALQRFYRAYAYIDSVTHGVAPEEA
jgi:hypothetical protein